jgi:hypothetical protein
MVEDMGRDQMRAADADRQRVADQLRGALEEGRLDLSEYDERVKDAYAAKTYGDLDRLLTDLPNAAPVVPAPPPAPPAKVDAADGLTHAWLRHLWSSWLSVAGFLSLIWALGWISEGRPDYFWPVWVIGPWAVLLAVRTAAGLVRGEPRARAAEVEHRRLLREHRQERKLLYRQAIATGELPLNPSKQERKAFIAQAMAKGDLPPKPRKPAIGG